MQKMQVCNILCSLVYGWVEDITPDNDTASPQSFITADEGETIILHIFHTKNGRSPPGGFGFNIEAGGNAICNSPISPYISCSFYMHVIIGLSAPNGTVLSNLM